MIRICPICNYKKSKIIYIQKFAAKLSHRIAACDNCGFVFVRNTPDQKYYDRYYKNMSKYELERDHKLHSVYRQIIAKFCQRSARILDIGCSTGHLLSLLKKSGFRHLSGIDPAPKCRQIAKREFDIDIETANLYTYKPGDKFDLVILAMVLEHLTDLKSAVARINKFLVNTGKVFISVPDANSFYREFEEPFGEFSTEHLNFFSMNYLYPLIPNFTCLYSKSDKKNLYSVWQKTDDLKTSITSYIKLSQVKMRKIRRTLDHLPEKVLVWGAGSLTLKLLKMTDLLSKTVVFIDNNQNLIGTTLCNKKIIPPSMLSRYQEPVLISSFRFKEEIRQQIKSLKCKNEVIVF